MEYISYIAYQMASISKSTCSCGDDEAFGSRPEALSQGAEDVGVIGISGIAQERKHGKGRVVNLMVQDVRLVAGDLARQCLICINPAAKYLETLAQLAKLRRRQGIVEEVFRRG